MTATKTSPQTKWSSALSTATSEAYLTGLAHKPTPMVVYTPKGLFDNTPDLTQPVYHVPAGPCGFAWVNLKAKKGPEGKEARQFLNWLLGRTKPVSPDTTPTAHPGFRLPDKKSYYGGYDIWVSGFDQSVECKAAAARVLAKSLEEAVPGLIAWPMDRLD